MSKKGSKKKNKENISSSLKMWFKIHFIVDMVFAIPLFFFPNIFLNFLGFTAIEPITARLVAAALFGIGGTSYFAKTKDEFSILLTLKLIWSSAAFIGLVWSAIQVPNVLTWILALIFAIFFIIWLHYKNQKNS